MLSSPPLRALCLITSMASGALCLAQAQQPTDPTAAQPAENMARAWQQASSKYDAARSAILSQVDRGASDGPFRPDWGSLSKYEVPAWYRDAKFGIFIHWGVYSVPAFGSEWYPRNMYIAGSKENQHQVATYGPLTKFGYKDFIPMFKAEHYDPQAWAHLFQEAGARYVIPVFEHHDGFQMYDSNLSDWTAAKMGPHRDVAGDLEKAVRAEGLHFGASSHRIEHDWFLNGGRAIPSDVNDPRYAAFYGPAQIQVLDAKNDLAQDWTHVSPAYAEDWLARDAEIVQKYHPDIIFFDWWIGQPAVRPYLAKFAAYYYNESLKKGPVGIITYKLVDMQKSSAVLDIERGQLDTLRSFVWQTDTSVSNKSWGYIEHDTFKTPDFIVHQLVDIVSKNGNLLLNIGPRSDGTIPEEVQQVLLGVGAWLKVNGEAIYGTRPWTVFGEGPTRVAAGSFHDTQTQAYTAEDFRFTTKGSDLYAIELAWPANGEAVIHSLGTDALKGEKIQAVSLLGSDARLSYQQEPDGLHIHLPAKPAEGYAYAFRVGLSK
ncbi:MAG TPA: alpha-L-fucosidase [Acidobacteriaceae bacterium]|nr:alpha-L-fucosidase [Acidobacteriaceae bacterium]